MRYIKTYELFSNLFNNKNQEITNKETSNEDEKELTELFWLIKDNYDDDNLQRFDGAMYGYYFIYTIDNHLKIEVGLNSVRKYENNNCTLLKVSKSLINEIVDFFETKNKGKIRPDIKSSPGW